MTLPLTQAMTLKTINTHLQAVGLRPTSRSNFYRLRDLYVAQYPKSRWLANGRLVYSEPVVLYLYFLARLHSVTQSFRLTEMTAQSVVHTLPGRFSECFRTFSDIDSFFLNQMPQPA